MNTRENNFEYNKRLRDASFFKKLNNYLDSLKRDPSFLAEIRILREELRIPRNGFKNVRTKEEYIELACEHGVATEYTDTRFQDLVEKYKLDIFGEAFEYFLFFNNLDSFEQFGYLDYADCIDLKSYFYDDSDENNIMIGVLKHQTDTEPIAILINPYMTQRDIIDFIKKVYKSGIQPLQRKYRENIVLGTARTKSKKVAGRNKFIYNNRNKPIKLLMSLVHNKFNEVLDYSYIQKIIRDESANAGN